MKMTVGVLDHYNVSTRKEAAKRHLSEMRVLYHVNQVPNSARWQIFLRVRTTSRSSLISRARMKPAFRRRRTNYPSIVECASALFLGAYDACGGSWRILPEHGGAAGRTKMEG